MFDCAGGPNPSWISRRIAYGARITESLSSAACHFAPTNAGHSSRSVNPALQTALLGLLAFFSVVLSKETFAADPNNPGADPLAWLARAQKAAKEQTFVGVFVHAVGDAHSTSRITHTFFNNEEVEKIESLDGPMREFLRKGTNLQCFIPEVRTIRSDRRVTGRHFPQIVQTSVEQIASNYNVMLGSGDRVAGYDCRWLHLDPRDSLRYAQRICSEISTGLLLRARLMSGPDQAIEQFTFTELKIGARVQRHALRSRWDDEKANWRQEQIPANDAQPANTGWLVTNPPAGFTKIAEMRRTMPSQISVDHLIFSDGVASISVFMEPTPEGKRVGEATSEKGCASIYTGSINNHMVTVLGEVPLAATKQVGKSVAQSAKPTRSRQ